MVTQQKKRVTDTVLSSIAAMFVAMSMLISAAEVVATEMPYERLCCKKSRNEMKS